jgi:hypothetical protein
MSKAVSELADAIFAFRTVGPNSLAAILEWLGEHVEKERIKGLAERVRSLDRGEALVVSPGWLKFEGVVRIRLRETFDSSATVKGGERARAPRGVGAKPDLANIRHRMEATIERVKADDPRELRKQLAEARAELKRAQAAKPGPAAAPAKTRDVPVLKDGQITRIEKVVDRARDGMATLLKRHAEQVDALSQRLQVVVTEVGLLRDQIKPVAAGASRGGSHEIAHQPTRAPAAPQPAGAIPPRARRVEGTGGAAGQLSGVEQRILDALAELKVMGVHRPQRIQAAFLAGYTNLSSKGFVNGLSSLSSGGYVGYPGSGMVALTPRGDAYANAPAAPSAGCRVGRLRQSELQGIRECS